MTPTTIIRKLIMRGSDDLVEALYRRLTADRLTWPYARWPDAPAKTWRDLAERALAERALRPAEARVLWSMESTPQAWAPPDPPPAAAKRGGQPVTGAMARGHIGEQG